MNLAPVATSPIERLTEHVRTVLYLPDPSPLYVLMGAVAANIIEGPPVWLLFVGPPSCGKTEILNSLLDVPRVVGVSDVAGEAAFLSGSPTKDLRRDSTGGILRQTGDHGALVINDFTSILSKPRDKLVQIMAVLREAYGGRWQRHIGGEGGRELSWAGKLAVFAGSTGKIDQYAQIAAELGERWVYFRYPERDGFQELALALDSDRGEWRHFLRDRIKEFLAEQCLSFTSTIKRRTFLSVEKLHIYDIAQVAVRCRSGVARDAYTKEIIGARERELVTRMGAVLGQLLMGLEYVGVPEATRWKLLHQIAMDSMPQLRRIVVEAVQTGPQTIEQLQERCTCDTRVVKRIVEDLQVHGIVLTDGKTVHQSHWMHEYYRPKLWSAARA